METRNPRTERLAKGGGAHNSVDVIPGCGARALLCPEALTWGPGKTLKENSWQQRGGEEGALPGTKERVGDFLFP